jgi:hypothetical protein
MGGVGHNTFLCFCAFAKVDRNINRNKRIFFIFKSDISNNFKF